MKRSPAKLLALGSAAAMTALAQAAPIEVSLDTQKTGEPIHPFIYGQFIEHLGRCIYGGIWAEMLEDRKFYFPIEAKYDPYRALIDTDFPVVGASPWEIIGEPESVAMVKEDSFVGDQTPRLSAGAGIRQRDLAIVAGKGYQGYIWIKAAGRGRTEVSVTLAADLDGAQVQERKITVRAGDYRKYPFTFKAESDSPKATLTVKALTGDVFVGTLSLMPDDNVKGMRPDTLALLKELDAPVYRWPGGNFVSGYDWRDGIGDRDRRPPRGNPAWTGIEHNDFGTDEFIEFCRLVGTEPTIAANTGFGDEYSAAQWVEYCNRGADTIGGSWRVKNGNREPYNVKYWCVGNEMWGPFQLGFMQLHHYTLKHNRVAQAMSNVDDSLVLIAVGAIDQINREHDPVAASTNRLWSVGMMEDCADHMDMISEHFYSGRVPWNDEQELPTLEHVPAVKNQIRRIVSEHRRLQPTIKQIEGRTIPIALDEWNYWHREYAYGELGCIYDLKDGLGIVAGLHELYRSSDLIKIANYAQTVNVIGCIKTTKTEAEFETTGIALALYRAQWQDIPLELPDEFGHHDVAAAISEDGKVLTLSIVNPTDADSIVKVDLANATLPAAATSWTITGPDHRAHNTPGKPRVIDAEKAEGVDISSGFASPALSSVLYRIEL